MAPLFFGRNDTSGLFIEINFRRDVTKFLALDDAGSTKLERCRTTEGVENN